MTVPEVIDTDRLQLKRPNETYAQVIFDTYASDAAVTKYLSWAPHTDVGQTVEYLRSVDRNWNDKTAFAWSIFCQADNRLIGMIDLRIDGFHAECGYLLAQPFWGKGYMSETLVALRHVVFSMPEIERFQLICDVDNPASAKVMEKAGFEKEGIMRKSNKHPNVSDRPRDCYCYSYVRP